MVCELCNILNQEFRIIKENDHAFAAAIRDPQAAGHSLILPKRHVEHLSDLTPDEAKAFNVLLTEMMDRCKERFNKFAIAALNSGIHKSQPHVHVHVLPSDNAFRDIYAKCTNQELYVRATNEEMAKAAEKLR